MHVHISPEQWDKCLRDRDELAELKQLKMETNQNSLVAVYAVDWNQYAGQHDPNEGEPYKPANGWVFGSLIEETETHLAIAHTVFDTGHVRYVVVLPKCTIIKRKNLGTVKRIMEGESCRETP